VVAPITDMVNTEVHTNVAMLIKRGAVFWQTR